MLGYPEQKRLHTYNHNILCCTQFQHALIPAFQHLVNLHELIKLVAVQKLFGVDQCPAQVGGALPLANATG